MTRVGVGWRVSASPAMAAVAPRAHRATASSRCGRRRRTAAAHAEGVAEQNRVGVARFRMLDGLRVERRDDVRVAQGRRMRAGAMSVKSGRAELCPTCGVGQSGAMPYLRESGKAELCPTWGRTGRNEVGRCAESSGGEWRAVRGQSGAMPYLGGEGDSRSVRAAWRRRPPSSLRSPRALDSPFNETAELVGFQELRADV
jgi:hypothetical protein